MLQEICSKKTKKEKLQAIEKLIPEGDWFDIDNIKEDEEWFNYYIEDFEDTIKRLNELINAPDFKDADYYYYIWY